MPPTETLPKPFQYYAPKRPPSIKNCSCVHDRPICLPTPPSSAPPTSSPTCPNTSLPINCLNTLWTKARQLLGHYRSQTAILDHELRYLHLRNEYRTFVNSRGGWESWDSCHWDTFFNTTFPKARWPGGMYEMWEKGEWPTLPEMGVIFKDVTIGETQRRMNELRKHKRALERERKANVGRWVKRWEGRHKGVKWKPDVPGDLVVEEEGDVKFKQPEEEWEKATVESCVASNGEGIRVFWIYTVGEESELKLCGQGIEYL